MFVMCKPPPEWRHDRSIHDAVEVRFSFRREPGVKIVGCFLGPQDANVPPEISVDRRTQLVRRETAFDHHIRDLSLGMDAGVGPPRPNNAHFCILEHPDHAFELALDGAVVFLDLPSMKIGAVVLDKEFVVHVLCGLWSLAFGLCPSSFVLCPWFSVL